MYPSHKSVCHILDDTPEKWDSTGRQEEGTDKDGRAGKEAGGHLSAGR